MKSSGCYFHNSHQLYRAEALNYAAVNEKTEERAGVASQGPHVRVTKLIAAQWHSALGSAQMKKGLRKKRTEHKACMLMCQVSKLARG